MRWADQDIEARQDLRAFVFVLIVILIVLAIVNVCGVGDAWASYFNEPPVAAITPPLILADAPIESPRTEAVTKGGAVKVHAAVYADTERSSLKGSVSVLSAASVHPEAAYIAGLNAPYVPMPLEMAVDAGTVWLSCESKPYRKLTGLEARPYVNPADAIGEAGERGGAQIHPIHSPEMRLLGLDSDVEWDRVAYAAHKWSYTGWGPWSCQP